MDDTEQFSVELLSGVLGNGCRVSPWPVHHRVCERLKVDERVVNGGRKSGRGDRCRRVEAEDLPRQRLRAAGEQVFG